MRRREGKCSECSRKTNIATSSGENERNFPFFIFVTMIDNLLKFAYCTQNKQNNINRLEYNTINTTVLVGDNYNNGIRKLVQHKNALHNSQKDYIEIFVT